MRRDYKINLIGSVGVGKSSIKQNFALIRSSILMNQPLKILIEK